MVLAPQERDVHMLLRTFLRKVDAGAPPAYATFRDAWQELSFTLVYEVHSWVPKPIRAHTSTRWSPQNPFHAW